MELDFSDKNLIKEILLSCPDVDYHSTTFSKFLHLQFDHLKFQGTGETLLRKHLGVCWKRTAEDYELFLGDVLGDYLFEQMFDSVEEVDKRIIKNLPAQEPTPEDFAICNERKNFIYEMLGTLSSKEERVIKMRFGIGDQEHTLEEVGRKLSRSPARVRQIEARALRKLKHPSRLTFLRRLI